MYKHFLHNRSHIYLRVYLQFHHSLEYICICTTEMALTKRTRFILVQSTNNANVNEDNMEPYHISIFRRSTSMPPLPRLGLNRTHSRIQQQVSLPSPNRAYRHERSESSNTKSTIHAMKRKSVRFSRRLSSVLGFTAQTIDEQFNFQEQRFRAVEKFLKIFLRHAYTSVETLRVNPLDRSSI